jgi:hypothetical protein
MFIKEQVLHFYGVLLPIRDRPSTLTTYSIRDHHYILTLPPSAS